MLLFIQAVLGLSRNDVLEVTKSVTPATDKDGEYVAKIGYKVVGEAGKLTKVEIVDSLPPNVNLIAGSLVLKAADPTAQFTYHSYRIALNVDKHDYSLRNRTVDVVLAPAEVSYVRKSATEKRETLLTDSVTLTSSVKELVPKGGWLLNGVAANAVVAFFTLGFPLVAAVQLINIFHQRALTKAKKSK